MPSRILVIGYVASRSSPVAEGAAVGVQRAQRSRPPHPRCWPPREHSESASARVTVFSAVLHERSDIAPRPPPGEPAPAVLMLSSSLLFVVVVVVREISYARTRSEWEYAHTSAYAPGLFLHCCFATSVYCRGGAPRVAQPILRMRE